MHKIFGAVFFAIAVPCVSVRAVLFDNASLHKLFVDKESLVLPTGGAWEYKITEDLARTQLGRCINPELEGTHWLDSIARRDSWQGGTEGPRYGPARSSDISTDGLEWVSELRAEAASAASVPRPLKAWGQSYRRTLSEKIMGHSIGKVLPSHRAVGLTSDRTVDVPGGVGDFFPVDSDYPVSKCQSYDYTSVGSVPDVPDPHGCRLFSKSFAPLQGLKQCIVANLEGSAMWKRYRAVARAVRKARPGGTRLMDTPERITEKDLTAVADPELLAEFQGCPGSGKCVILDANLRADEMIKYLGFKDWSEVDHLISWVNSKVRFTASVYREEGGPVATERQKKREKEDGKNKKKPNVVRQLGLENDVVELIVSECFGVTADTYAALPEKTKILQRSLTCNPLMFDTVEVAGPPQPPLVNAAGMWDQFPEENQGKEMVVGRLMETPPVCARAAMALVGNSQVKAPDGYAPLVCLKEEKRSWKSCTTAKTYNCICLEKCWRAALRRVCELAPDGCCGDINKLN